MSIEDDNVNDDEPVCYGVIVTHTLGEALALINNVTVGVADDLGVSDGVTDDEVVDDDELVGVIDDEGVIENEGVVDWCSR